MKKLFFKLNQINNISIYKQYNYQESINQLLLPAQYFPNISKVFKFYDSAISKCKPSLFHDKDKNLMILSFKIPIGFEEIESKIILNEKKFTNEEMLEKYKIKEKQNNENEMISKLIKKIEELEEKVNLLFKYKEENEKAKKEMESKINSLIEENKMLKNNYDKIKLSRGDIQNKKEINDISNETDTKKENNKQNLLEKEKIENKNNFNYILTKFKLKKYLTYANNSSGFFKQFAVYIGLKDKIEYLVFSYEYSIKIMVIKNKNLSLP